MSPEMNSSLQLLRAPWECWKTSQPCRLSPGALAQVGRGQWDGLLAAASGASASWTLSPGVVWKYRSEGGDGGQGSCAAGLLSVPPSSGW